MPPHSRAGPWGGPVQWSTSQDTCACLSPASAAGGGTLCHSHTPFLGVSRVSWNSQTCVGVGSDLALGSESIQHQCCLEVGWAWDVLVPFLGAGGQSELPAATSISSISSQGPFPRPGMTLLTATPQPSPACPSAISRHHQPHLLSQCWVEMHTWEQSILPQDASRSHPPAPSQGTPTGPWGHRT